MPLCTTCQARPAKFNDLCCVHYSGERDCVNCGTTFVDGSEVVDMAYCEDCRR